MRDRDMLKGARAWQRRWKRGVERAFAPDMKEFRFEIDEVELMMDLDPAFARKMRESGRQHRAVA